VTLLGSKTAPAPAPAPRIMVAPTLDTQITRSNLQNDIKMAVRSELLNANFGNNYDDMYDDSFLDSISSQQGKDFMRYIPGKNPDEYIRKDSIPVYGGSLLTN
jgi:hypothetical protein